MKNLLTYTALVLLLLACSGNDADWQEENAVAVSFDAVMLTGQGTTRAANDIDNKAELAAAGGFGVFACYTGMYKYADSSVNPDFMYNERVTSTDGGVNWEYTPVKYWPNGEGETDGNTGEIPHYVSFFAYAPYSDNNDRPDNPAGYCISGFSHQADTGNPWLTYRLHTNVSDQVDLLYDQLLDQGKPDVDAKLLFHFKHALACVGDKVTIQCTDNLKTNLAARIGGSVTKMDVVLKRVIITYSLTEKGRLVLWNGGEANWQPVLSGNTLVTRVQDLSSYITPNPCLIYETGGSSDMKWTAERTGSLPGPGVFYIPLDLPENPQEALITVSYEIRHYLNGDPDPIVEYDRTAWTTLTLSEYEDAFKPGMHLYINIGLDDTTLIATAAITDWVTVGSVSTEAY